MTKAATNVKNLGPGTITWNSTTMGHCSGAELTITEKVNEFTVDTYGDAPVEAVYGGVTCQLKVIANEYTMTELGAFSAGATKIIGTTTTGTKVGYGKVVGTAVTSSSLTYKTDDTAKTPSFDITIPGAFISGNPRKIDLGPDKPAFFEVIFRGKITEASAEGLRMVVLGNNTAVV
jgi:hypothetical protein